MKPKSLRLLPLLSFLAFTGSFVLSGCSYVPGGPVQSGDRNITSIALTDASQSAPIYVGEFDEAHLELLVTYSDGTSENVPLTESMLPSSYREYLSKPGDYNVTLLFRGQTIRFPLHISYHYFTVDFYALVTTSTLEKISTQSIKKGEAALAPTMVVQSLAYEHTLHSFKGWDVDFSNVTSDLTVTAAYDETAISWVSFYNGANALIKKEYVKNGEDAVAPSAEERAMAGYDFLGWDRPFTAVTKDLEIYGLYFKVTPLNAKPSWDGTIATSFAGGSGSQSDPYLISQPSELAYLASTSDTQNYSGVYFKQTGDLDLGSLEWKPIGYCTSETWTTMGFQGHYDGGNHAISNLKISSIRTDGYYGNYYVGLFGWIRYGSVSNLTLNDFSISVTATSVLYTGVSQSTNEVYFGSLIGEIRSGTTENCSIGSGESIFNGTKIDNKIIGFINSYY